MPRALVASGVLALGLFCSLRIVQGQAPGQAGALSIQSLTEPAEGFAVKDVSAQTGLATFASSPGAGMLLPLDPASPAAARALSFVDAYGRAFGLADSSQVRLIEATQADALGVEHVRLQQVHKGVPVRAGEFLVHLKGSRAMAANGHITNDLPEDVTPRVVAALAQTAARQLIEKHRPDSARGAQYSEPRLEILNRGLLSDTATYPSRLAWFVEATGPTLREFIWVDAQSGGILLNFNQLTDLKSRRVYTANHTNTLPGTLVRTEGGPATGDADQDNAYTFAGITYDYYLTQHGRDSFDNLGGVIISTTHYCEPGTCPSFANAFWNGSQMVYGDTYASADDVVGHELTHAVTERTANLLYYVQSGAMNESFSDIFGETIDLTDGVGNDAAGVRWQMGEDLPIGAIRNMMNPNPFGDPAKMSDAAFFKCNTSAWNDPNGDSGGVHSNSGIPNKAYALMVDGGTFNGRTVTGIGLTKAGKIEYRALTTYLTSGSGFRDDYNALNQSCTDLIGTVGINAGDCTQVNNALLAVEMNATWACAGATQAPALCPTGNPLNTTLDTFESSIGNWTPTNTANGSWGRDSGLAKNGTQMLYGSEGDAPSDHRASMTTAVVIPAAGRMYFDHAFEFENDEFLGNHFDGGVLEHSLNNGTTWVDSSSLIDAGQIYNGTIDTGGNNPLEGRSAFVSSSFGYTGTRLNLASLAGQSVKFRFRIGTDDAVGSLGWAVDNVAIYRCVVGAIFTDTPLIAGSTPIRLVHINELRTRINAVRVAKGLLAFSFTDPTLVAGSTLVKAVHIAEMRTALSQAYVAAGMPAPTFTDPTLTTGTTVIKVVHINELRNAVIALE
jgi:Zn-dependent metalloprotease